MRTMITELGSAVRNVGRHLSFYALLVLTLGLGVGAVATTFSVVHGLVLDPFPFPEPDRIVGVGTAYPRLGSDLGFFENLSPAEFVDIRDHATTLEDVVAWDMGNRQIDTEGPPENVFSAFWWGDILTTVQMDPRLGRGFSDQEIRRGDAVAMISEDLWLERFGADSTMIGGALSINGNPYTLVGVFPRSVDIYGTELWMPMPVGPDVFPRNRRQFQVMARVARASSLSEVNAELSTLARQVEQAWASEFEEYVGWSIRALTWAEVNSQVFRAGVFVLMGAVTFVLLLVCANIANLLLARAQSRRREMAVRAALGAGRGRLALQVLAESVLLGASGGAIGILLAFLGVRGVNAFLSTLGLPVAGTVEVNGPVLAVSGLVAVGAGILFGVAPALQVSSTALQGTLQAESKGATASGSRQGLQRSLVGVQVALAFVLLTGAGLLLNSFLRVNAVDTGFDTSNVLTLRLTLPPEKYRGPEVPAFFSTLTRRLEALPGIREAGAGTQYPGVAFSFREVAFEGGPVEEEGSTLPTLLATVVTPGYFEALGIPLRRGRTFTQDDGALAPNVVVLNEEAARRYLGTTDVVGARLRLQDAGPDTLWWEIVGVVGSTRNLGLDEEPYPELFASHEQVGGVQNQLFLVLRTAGDPSSFVSAVRETVLRIDPDQPVYAIRTAEETYAQGVASMRAVAVLLSLFGGFALILAAVGIYSVVSYTVSGRTKEIGVRVALGADRGRVRRLVVRQALLPVLLGASAGGAAAVALGGGLERLLYGVRATDPLTLGLVGGTLVAVAAAASWVPAFRAARLDPVTSLRIE